MTSEPPSDMSSSQDEDVAERPDRPELPDEPTREERHTRLGSIVLAVVALTLATGAGLYLFFFSQGSSQTQENSAPTRGLACPHLVVAADAYARGDFTDYREEIGLAEKAAEDALQTSGQVFGEPEHIALELGLTVDENPTQIKRLLELGVHKCETQAAP
jgi:uncharacterized protein HemX